MEKLISRNQGYYLYRSFIMCDCSEEIVEFYKDTDGEYIILPHCWYNRKLDRYSSFCFNGEVDFIIFIKYLKAFLANEINNDVYIELDRYMTYKDKMPGVLTMTSDDNYLFICKFANLKTATNPKKCVWEIVLRKEEVEELVKELETFLN